MEIVGVIVRGVLVLTNCSKILQLSDLLTVAVIFKTDLPRGGE